jgi:ATP-dependent Clp protease protease subunit
MRNRLLNLFRVNAQKGSIKADGNTIWLYDFIVSSEDEASWFGGVSAEGFAKLMAEMTGPVTVRLNSPGGDVFGGRAIAQAIRGYQGEVTVQIDGLAASAASTIAVAGDKVIGAPDAMMMIHEAWTFTVGNKRDHISTSELLSKIDDSIAEGYAAKAGEKADTDWANLMEKESWFTAAEALNLGLIDEIMPSKVEKTSNAIAWDLSVFDHAPKAVDAEPDALAQQDAEPDDVAAPVVEPAPQATADHEIAARQRQLAVDLL